MITLHTDIRHIPDAAHGCVLAIGNFDGVHLGHRALIGKAKEIAAKEKAPLGVLTFEPHPRRFFQPQSEPFRITPLPMKKDLLGDIGVEHLFALEFNEDFSRITADDFINRILVDALKARHIVVGEDFAFGHRRSGTVKTLKAAEKFKVTALPIILSPEGHVYSSSAIRALIKEGKTEEARAMLGWPKQAPAPAIHAG